MIKHLPIALIHGFFIASLGSVFAIKHFAEAAAAKTDQPISAFSHRVHVAPPPVGQGIACTECHQYVDRGRRPGIPPLKVCVDCHKTGDKPGQLEVKKYFDEGKPVHWNRIHTLPEHVYFTHKRHIKALSEKMGLPFRDEKGNGIWANQTKLCAICHGEVKYMDKIRQVRSLTMGWCVSCHRENGASFDCWTCHK